jgi:hypothetical protein
LATFGTFIGTSSGTYLNTFLDKLNSIDNYELILFKLLSDVTAQKALVDFNVTKKNQIVMLTRALRMLCVRTNPGQEISHVCVNLDILVKIVPLALTHVKSAHALTELSARANNKEGSVASALMAGKDHFVIKTLMTALKSHAY